MKGLSENQGSINKYRHKVKFCIKNFSSIIWALYPEDVLIKEETLRID